MKKLKTWLRRIWPISQEKFEQKVEADCLFQTNVFDEIKTLDSNISEQKKLIGKIALEVENQGKKLEQYQKAIGNFRDEVLEYNKQLEEKKEVLLKKQLEMVDSIESRLEKLKRSTNEIVWGQVFNNTIADSSWLKNKFFSPGRWALGYPALYALYRILNEFHPQNILELGLGQSSVMTLQYASAFPNVNHIIMEHDKTWIDFFEKTHSISNNSKLMHMNIEYVTYNNVENVRVYQDFINKLGENTRFDFVIIDAPIGGDMKCFSRIDVISMISDYLSEQFVIMLDDADRMQERRTMNEIDKKFKDSGIDAKRGLYSGEKDTCIWTSSMWHFLLTM